MSTGHVANEPLSQTPRGKAAGLLLIHVGYPPDDLRACLGDQTDWFRAAIGATGGDLTVVRPFLGEALPEPAEIDAAIITGSWSMVTDREPWSERTADWLRLAMAADTPLLGVCYGHQLMAHALGGEVDYHPRGREIGMRDITLTDAAKHDVLLEGLPDSFPAHLTHAQSVLTVPSGAVVLGSSEHDAHQILRYGPNALSVQFHPEFTPTIMSVCLERYANTYQREGYNVAEMIGMLQPTVAARTLLRRFVARYVEGVERPA